jgi:hypothetical protein
MASSGSLRYVLIASVVLAMVQSFSLNRITRITPSRGSQAFSLLPILFSSILTFLSFLYSAKHQINMVTEHIGDLSVHIDNIPTWVQLVQQGIADAAVAAEPSKQIICPGFGEPGWGMKSMKPHTNLQDANNHFINLSTI